MEKIKEPSYISKIGSALAIAIRLLLSLQIVPLWVLKTNPTVVTETTWDRLQTRAIAKRACFDCHSNIGEVITKGEMPMPMYLVMHPKANLTMAEKKAFAGGLAKSLR